VEGMVKPDTFRDLSAVILTHQHPDHVDDAALKKILENNRAAIVITNTEIKSRLDKEGVVAAEVLEDGSRAIGNFTVKALVAQHAPILNAVLPQNIAYVVNNTLLHPGDSFASSLDAWKGIPVLALPIMAPWMTELEVAEFARRMSPQKIIPVHDGYAKDFFLQQRYENYQKYFSPLGIDFQWLDKPGDSIEV